MSNKNYFVNFQAMDIKFHAFFSQSKTRKDTFIDSVTAYVFFSSNVYIRHIQMTMASKKKEAVNKYTLKNKTIQRDGEWEREKKSRVWSQIPLSRDSSHSTILCSVE